MPSSEVPRVFGDGRNGVGTAVSGPITTASRRDLDQQRRLCTFDRGALMTHAAVMASCPV